MNHAAQPDDTAIVSESRIAAYLRGELSSDERARLEAAMDRDPAWLGVLAVLARESSRPAPAPVSESGSMSESAALQLDREHAARIVPGDRVGRYRVDRCIGEGGMGRVWAAVDPQLDRAVAIKVLRTSDPRAQARLVREARALAQLSSPHVVSILDVGTWRGRVFVAMELVDGPDLRQWALAEARPWQAIVEAYVAAGRGLAAAHAVGVIHRDFKPANAMRRSDGRVVVLDFGLAEAVVDPTASSEGGDELLARAASTTAGGTRAYMAPEQRRNEPCTVHSDQFSFCVALFEALHGELPAVTEHGLRRDKPRAQGTWPTSIDRLLEKGLARAPGDRHASMSVLLEGLARALVPRASRRGSLAIAALAAVGAATWLVGRNDRGPCDRSADALAGAFTPDDARAVGDAIAELPAPWSAQTSAGVRTGLTAYGQAWMRAHEAVCRATHGGGDEDVRAHDVRMRCLDRGRARLGALVEVLRDPDIAAASRSILAVNELPSPADCVSLASAAVALPDTPTARAEADAIVADLGRIDALRRAQRWVEADVLAAAAMARAGELGHGPTEADAILAAAGVAQDRGDHPQAERLLREAVLAGEASGHDEAVAIAWNRLTWVVGHELARHDEGRECARRASEWTGRLSRTHRHRIATLRALGWIEHDDGAHEVALGRFAEALALAEAPDESGFVSRDDIALVLNGTGAAALGVGRLEDAERAFARAADELTADLGPDHPDVARVRNNVAALRRANGQPDVAVEIFERNLAVFDGTFGAAHSDAGTTRINLAVALLDLGRFSEAHAHADDAVASLQRALGPDHPTVARALTIRGDAQVQLGRPGGAIADFTAALAIEVEALGTDHPSVAILESNLGDADYAQADLARAEHHQRRALAILEGALGEEHPNVAFVLVGLGLTLRDRGHVDEALALFRRAAAIADPSLLPNAITRVGEILLERGDVAGARAHLERASELQRGIATSDALVGDTLRALARARWAAGDREGARAAAREAITRYEAVADREHADLVRAWMARVE
jgi:tetratricopeptide (TPR) repeat protein/tRNA A-37 threonylcarbamoyl transferase component Bud32